MKRFASTFESATVRVRDGRPEDRSGLLELYDEFRPRGGFLGLPPRDVAGWLDHLTDCPAVLAETDGHVVAHGVLCPQGDAAEIVVFVHQNYRGAGLGRRIMLALLDRGREIGIRRAWGITDADNLPMMRLARSLGFLPGTEMDVFELALHPAHPREAAPKPQSSQSAEYTRRAA